jgi:hypothetical protein
VLTPVIAARDFRALGVGLDQLKGPIIPALPETFRNI